MVSLEEFWFGPQRNVKMHFIRGETHLGTHVESPYKVSDDGKDIVSMPLDTFIGEAVIVDCSRKKPDEPITPEDFEREGVREGDRVLVRGPVPMVQPLPYLSSEGAKWLAKKKIKLLAMQNCTEYLPEELRGELPEDKCNGPFLFKNNIARIDAITSLDQVKKKRVILIALPLNFERMEASWTRAILLEEKDHN